MMEVYSENNARKKLRKTNTVAIVLGYYNGEAFIEEQINSIFNQSHSDLHLFLFDDQSTRSFSITEELTEDENLSRLSISRRPERIGVVKNFLDGLNYLSENFEYYAFSDQDDIWFNDKLDRAIKVLENVAVNTPALYCTRTEVTDITCEQTLGFSPLFAKLPSFANALVQNIGGGNTMVFNQAAKDLITNSMVNLTVVAHDWWCYQIVSGSGGHVFYDPEPSLKYRQHRANVVGANITWHGRFVRLCGLFQGRFRKSNDINIEALKDVKHLITKDNLNTLDTVIEARQSRLIKRCFLFKRSGVCRQTFYGNLGLWLGILFNKV